MPRCDKCKEVMPPDVMIDKFGHQVCVFCDQLLLTIRIDGHEVSKDWVKNDYLKYLDVFAEKLKTKMDPHDISKYLKEFETRYDDKKEG